MSRRSEHAIKNHQYAIILFSVISVMMTDESMSHILNTWRIGSLAGKGQATPALPDPEDSVLEAVPDVSGKHRVLGEALGVDPRRVKLG